MIKRKCSNCKIEIEYKDEYVSNLVFCSKKCSDEFFDRDSKIRKELGLNQLEINDENDNRHYNLTIPNIPRITVGRIQDKLKNMTLTYNVEEVTNK